MDNQPSAPEIAPDEIVEAPEPEVKKKKAKNPITPAQKVALEKARQTKIAKQKAEKEAMERENPKPKKSHKKVQDQDGSMSNSTDFAKPVLCSDESEEEEVVVRKKPKATKKPKRKIVY
ncbi:hypothetical protein HDU88_001338, partial [Geranomyces variabilis]